jgi:hypothetical protein
MRKRLLQGPMTLLLSSTGAHHLHKIPGITLEHLHCRVKQGTSERLTQSASISEPRWTREVWHFDMVVLAT